MADTLAVLGSKARLKILRQLSRSDMYLSELMDTVGMDGNTANHHLSVLEEAGLVESYQNGQRRYFTLTGGVTLEVTPSPNRRFIAQLH